MGSEIALEPIHQHSSQPNSRRIKTLGNSRKWHFQKCTDIALRMFFNIEEHDHYSLIRRQLLNRGEHCFCQLVSFDCRLRISMDSSNIDAIVERYSLQTLPPPEAVTLCHDFAPVT